MREYKKAGVDILKADRLTESISGLVDNIGGFAGLYDLCDKSYLVASTDGVGTKILLAQEYNKLEGIGVDCVAMCVNDVICTGACPLFFLDYFASSNIDESQFLTVVNSIKKSCSDYGMSLLGGETAELPSLLSDKSFDVAGFCVGIVGKRDLIDGKTIKSGDSVIAFPSNGFHSNGYTLIRKILSRISSAERDNVIEDILKPTEIYKYRLRHLINNFKIKGVAHITGGGFSNLNRVLPEGLGVEWREDIPRAPIFDQIQEWGQLSGEEMKSVFNNGVGMCMVVSSKEKEKIAFEIPLDGKTFPHIIEVGQIK
jgi:phosphoribosylformylglycinamidine cyclo-ligase